MGCGKSVGPRKFLEQRCPDVLNDGLTHEVHAHAIDGTAEIHRDPGVLALSEGGMGLTKAHFKRFHRNYIVRRNDGTVETQAVFWCYDNAKHVSVIKGWTQSGRISKVGRSDVVLDVDSTGPLPAGPGFQALLRAEGNRDRAARGIRDSIFKERQANGTVSPTPVFCGVPGSVVASSACEDNSCNPRTTSSSSSRATIALSGAVGAPSTESPSIESGTGRRTGPPHRGHRITSIQGHGELLGGVPLSKLDPQIGEGEMATVHFIFNYRRYLAPPVALNKWLVTSVDTDQWVLILLAMGTGRISEEGSSRVDVTVARHLRSKTEYVHVNRVYDAILNLRNEGIHAGWPDKVPWLSGGTKAFLFVLVYVLSGL